MLKKLLPILILILSAFFSVAYAQDFAPCTDMVTGVEYNIQKDTSGNMKYFRFTAPADGFYIISDNGACREYFYIHDENKEAIARAGYSADAMSLEIIRKMSKGDIYYFSAGAKYGGYTLTISPFDTKSVNWMNENEEYNTEPKEQIGPCTPEVLYFCPTADGYYNFSASGIGDCSGRIDLANINSMYSHAEVTSMHSDYYFYGCYLLKKDMVYPVLATCGSSGRYNTSMRYYVYYDYMDLRGSYKIGNTLSFHTYASHIYYSLVADKTSKIIIRNQGDIYDWDFKLYDTVTGESVPAYYDNCAIECSVVADRQYYLVLESGEYELCSAYIEDEGNSTAFTVSAMTTPQIKNARVDFSAMIANNLDKKSAVFTAVLYDATSGRVLDIHTKPITSKKEYTYFDDVSLSAGTSKNVQLKLLLWDSASRISPLAKAAEYNIK